MALRPDAAEQARQVVDLGIGDRQHDIAGAQVGAFGRSAIGEPDHDQPAFHFRRIEAEPRPRWRIAPAEFQEVVEDWAQ